MTRVENAGEGLPYLAWTRRILAASVVGMVLTHSLFLFELPEHLPPGLRMLFICVSVLLYVASLRSALLMFRSVELGIERISPVALLLVLQPNPARLSLPFVTCSIVFGLSLIATILCLRATQREVM